MLTRRQKTTRNALNAPRRGMLARLLILAAGAGLGMLLRSSDSLAQTPWCPIAGCVDKVGPNCGVCKTINGSYTVYKPQKPLEE